MKILKRVFNWLISSNLKEVKEEIQNTPPPSPEKVSFLLDLMKDIPHKKSEIAEQSAVSYRTVLRFYSGDSTCPEVYKALRRKLESHTKEQLAVSDKLASNLIRLYNLESQDRTKRLVS